MSVDDQVAAKALKSNTYDHVGWDDLVPVLGEGLQLLGDHVAGLVDTLGQMSTPELARGRKVVEVVADEEAAKVLIVLDLARAGRNDTPHTTTRYHWTVSNDTTGATIAHGTTTSLREAKDTCHTHLTPYLP